jgi:hypothetical protein
MTINEGQQPVITFIGTNENYEKSVLVSTTSDYMMVTGIQTELYKGTRTSRMENTGTIINPKYEVVETVKRDLTKNLICK